MTWRAALPAVLMALLAQAAIAGPASAQQPGDGGQGTVQEFTLSELGIPSRTASGTFPSLAVHVPPPAAALAASGSFIRLFFSHSPEVDATASTLSPELNGHALLSLPLSPATAAGSAIELPVPSWMLHSDRANLLQASFHLQPVAAGGARPEARLAAETLVHYRLSQEQTTSTSRTLRTYPSPILNLAAGSPDRVGVLMAPQPQAPELSAAFRVVTELGRLSGNRLLKPEVVTATQFEWLQSRDTSALLVGFMQRIPAASLVLASAGFTDRGGTLKAPDGEAVRDQDGVLAEVASPWNPRATILLVGGRSPVGLARAAAALARAPAKPIGRSYAVLHGDVDQAAESRVPDSTTVEASGETRMQGRGQHTVTFGFRAPAASSDELGYLDVDVRGSGRSNFSAFVNGGQVLAQSLSGDDRPRRIRLPLPGRNIQPGRNELTVRFDLQPEAAPNGGADTWAAVAPASAVNLPRPPGRETELRWLPFPFLDAGSGPRVVLSAPDDRTISAAARLLAALGSRSAFGTPPIDAGYADRPGSGSSRRNLIVVNGMWSSNSLSAPLKAARVDPAELPAGTAAIVREGPIPEDTSHRMLEVAATDEDGMGAAAAAIGKGRVGGAVAAIRRDGGLAAVGGAPGRVATAFALGMAVMLGALMLLLLLRRWLRPTQ